MRSIDDQEAEPQTIDAARLVFVGGLHRSGTTLFAKLLTGHPERLMSALQKISSGITMIPQRDLREVQGMNAFFIIPTNWKTNMSEWMMDHPPLEKRLAALSEIAREMGKPVS